MSLPIHRWFRYSGGFSAAWVSDVVARETQRTDVRLFDPFAGCATALISAEQHGISASGIDSHAFVARVARAKLSYRTSPEDYIDRAQQVIHRARTFSSVLDNYPALIRRCYTDESLAELDGLRNSIEATADDSETSQLVWLTLVSILRTTSYVGTANWQYLLPNKRKARTPSPFAAFQDMAQKVYDDMSPWKGFEGPRAVFNLDDARECNTLQDQSANLVITSPPYPNNYDYADATRLELAFFGEIENWGDLQPTIGRHLVRSCTQQVPNRLVSLGDVLSSWELDPIIDELRPVCEKLGEIRLTRGGKKTYHNMVACYFLDLAKVWHALRRVCEFGSKVCFVIGDSAPYGVYVPVIDWLGKLAVAAGFEGYRFEKTRDRNTKWANRKHRVPLCEGRLWVDG